MIDRSAQILAQELDTTIRQSSVSGLAIITSNMTMNNKGDNKPPYKTP